MKRLSFLTFVMLVTCIVASCGTTSQMGGSGCFGYWNTDGPLRGTRDANRNRSYPYRQCVEKTVSHSWWKIGRWPPRDDIPSIDSPRFILAAETDWLYSNSRVIGIEIEGNNQAIRCQFQTGMRSPTILSAALLYQSQFSRTVEPGWLFAGILTVRLLRLVFPVFNITLASWSMIGRANPLGLK